MEPLSSVEPLCAKEIHGFNTTAELNIPRLINDASKRWLRPNEVFAILSNHKLWSIQPQPVNLPSSGTLLLFDRKVLRNFRKDGHNWRKKKDGKTVQEAHEKLKMGNEEMIHVYYARNEDDPYFYRRCYWLLDRNLERIVLVHYRQTSEECTIQPSSIPIKPKETFHSSVASSNASNHIELPNCVFEEINSDGDKHSYTDFHTFQSVKASECEKHNTSLDENDRLYWKELMDSTFDLCAQENGLIMPSETKAVYQPTNLKNHPSSDHLQIKDHHKIDPQFHMGDTAGAVESQIAYLDGNMNGNNFSDNILMTHDSLEKWDYVVENTKVLLNGSQLEIQDLNNHTQNDFPPTFHFSQQEQVFTIVDISPSYTYHTEEETKIILVGYFHDSHKHLESSNVFCVIGDHCVPVCPIQVGVYRITSSTHFPGTVDLFLTLDGHTPISQVISFEYRSLANSPLDSREKIAGDCTELSNGHRDYKILLRLVHLLFTTTNNYSVLLNKLSPSSMRDVKKFNSATTSFLENQWKRFFNSNEDVDSISSNANRDLLDLILKNKLQEWLLLRMAEGCRFPSHDSQGQGIIHLCAMLDYTWAIRLFSLSSLSLDFRDKRGWAPLHWAAYYGREKTVATLLSAGANPSLVADPSPNFPGGCTPADLASQEGYEGLGAYLAEKGLRAHFQAMAISGNASSQLSYSADSTGIENSYTENLSEQELCLKDSLAAYRNAADAADRIQAAFRERSLKHQIKIAQSKSESEAEAAGIVAALKIQKAFKNHNRRKMMKAAVTIQGTFRTWQARKNFLNMRRQAVRIQAAFRGLRERKQYQKICWSVGVLEKALIRWRRKRKGLRGLQTESVTDTKSMEEENCIEEDFFRISREQAEDRVQRSVVRVQAMFRSYRTQQEYRRIKLAYNQANLECDEFGDPSNM